MEELWTLKDVDIVFYRYISHISSIQCEKAKNFGSVAIRTIMKDEAQLGILFTFIFTLSIRSKEMTVQIIRAI